MKGVEELLRDAPFFDGLRPESAELIAGCASNVHFDAGALVFREGEQADAFFLLRHGSVALETHSPARGPVVIETIEAGDVLGWSWLSRPTAGTSTRERGRPCARPRLTANACAGSAPPIPCSDTSWSRVSHRL